ncbi:MAG: hypothetical protein AAGI52_06475 [Bacteroidota bacterium]
MRFRFFETSETVLSPRRRAWALLCWSHRCGEAPAAWRIAKAFSTEAPGREFVAAVEGVGLAERVGETLVLTEAGREAARQTLLTGEVPTVVWLDPDEWRQQAWTAMRIHRRFSVGALLASGVVAHEEGIRVYLAQLERDGLVVRKERTDQWVLVRSRGPEAPLPTVPNAGERDAARPWQTRVRLAAARLGAGGAGFTTVRMEQTAGVDNRLVLKLFEYWAQLGLVMKAGWEPLRDSRGMGWWWSLTGPGMLDREPEAGGPAGVRQTVWDRLCDGERLRVADAASVFGSELHAARYLRQLVAGGLATSTRGGLHKAPPSEATPYPKGAGALRRR